MSKNNNKQITNSISNNNDSEDVRELHERHPLQTICLFLTCLIFIICVAIGVLYYNSLNAIDEKNKTIELLNESLAVEKDNVATLQLQLQELSDKNTILSDSLTSKSNELSAIEAEKIAMLVPNIYPLKGAASLVTDSEEDDKLQFVCSTGAKIVAAASGSVESVSLDANDSYILCINHGNGYKTEYRGKGLCLVTKDEVVKKEDIIFIVVEDNIQIDYRIKNDNKYINPMDVMEING